jgi:hypothetical protein
MRAISIYSSLLHPFASHKASLLNKLRTWLLSQKHKTECQATINIMISHYRQQMIKINQIKKVKTYIMLISIKCKFNIIKARRPDS